MTTLPYYVLDLFGAGTSTGDPLTVFPEAAALDDDQMKRLARTINHSETAFVTGGPVEGRFKIRIFNRQHELQWGVHSVLGAAFLLRHLFAPGALTLTLGLPIGPISVSFEISRGRVERTWVHHPAIQCGDRVPAAPVAAVLGIEPRDLDEDFPVREASTGSPFLLVPLGSLAAVQRARIRLERCEALSAGLEAKTLMVFTRFTDAPENQIHARVLANDHGSPEYAAMGNASGALAGYLLSQGYLGSGPVQARVEQGREVGRSTLVHLRGASDSGIQVGGPVELVAQGTFTIRDGKAVPPGSRALRAFGTSNFALMPALAEKFGAVNLSTGAPDLETPPALVQAAAAAMQSGQNQYSPPNGHPLLREAIAEHQRQHYQQQVDPATEVMVCCGAHEAIAAVILGLVNPGDEVALFEPFYENYLPCISLAGGVPRFITLRPPSFAIDPDELDAALGPRTRLLVLNTPHNPTGKVFGAQELALIAERCRERGVIVLADEVYQHLTYGTAQHVPIATLPGMAERTLTVSSTGKTFSSTGFRVGWALGPAALVAAAQAAHQFLTFSAPTPLQVGLAHVLRSHGAAYLAQLREGYAARRELLLGALADGGFRVFPPAGAYYVLGDFSALGTADDQTFARLLVEHGKVAAIPMSGFYRPGSRDGQKMLRFAFCKRPETLAAGADRLRAVRTEAARWAR